MAPLTRSPSQAHPSQGYGCCGVNQYLTKLGVGFDKFRGADTMQKTFNIGSSANIQNSASLRDELLTALDECEKVTIDASQLLDVDLSFFQTVYSAHLYAVKCGKTIEFTDDASEKLAATLVRAGLADLLPGANLNSWLHGGLPQ